MPRDPLERREGLLCDRILRVMQAALPLVRCRLEGRAVERVVAWASRAFRAITKVLQIRLAAKMAWVGGGLRRVLDFKRPFTRDLQDLLPVLAGETGRGATRKKITRQSRLVPGLVFQVEQCDVQLLKLGKLCRGSLDLSRWVTHRLDRDFKIHASVIAGCQEELRESREKKRGKGKRA
ncbi:unnamed protein product, partial [Discosporangium mesarthrocarpum]